jgi:orotidine-5'-phosphate decarboxylase
MRNPILAALDLDDAEKALRLARALGTRVGGFKIGSELFTRAGPDIVKRVGDLNPNIFLDLKFHDIPNTVAKAVASALDLNVRMLTVHACGGGEMMRRAEEAAQQAGKGRNEPPPLILGVTVLTSMDDPGLAETGVGSPVVAQVNRLAELAVGSGLRGLVCSPLEIADLRAALPSHIVLVTPGIRTEPAAGDDQKRTLTPKQALEAGANWLVIGRPIYAAADPIRAAETILASITG